MLAFVLAGLFYVSLYGELPYHDAVRFAEQLSSDRFVYDIGHVLLQPAALLWHRWLGFGEPVMTSQKHISTVAAAAAIAIFYGLLVRLGTARWLAVLAAALVAASCGIITLAPSAHFKLVALPFVTAALAVLTLAEVEERAHRPAVALAGGALLAVGAGFFAGTLTTPPFAALALMAAARREGAGWPRALLQAVLLGATCALLFALFAGGTYALINAGPLNGQGFAAALAAKEAVRPVDRSWADQAARAVFSTVNDFIAAPGLGAIARAWMSGQIPSLRAYAPALLPILVPWAATAAILAAVYVRAVIAPLHGRRCLISLAFVIGALVWAVGYNLNDPEHWVDLTAPTVLLFVTLFPPVAVGVGLPIWSALTIAINLALFAIPTATYPLARYEAQMQAQFTPRDLLISFAAYSGRPALSAFDLSGLRDLELDLALNESPNLDAFFASLDREITNTLDEGGRVMVFDLLDGSDWEAPWLDLTRRGLTKDRLYSHLASHFTVTQRPSIAELKVWQITAAPGS
ncbi:MAG: hypothetical protein JO157_01090 [Acetobacteraceae bacterium]|nr:hypothetical protein [Acetobacteraceae bacterium]